MTREGHARANEGQQKAGSGTPTPLPLSYFTGHYVAADLHCSPLLLGLALMHLAPIFRGAFRIIALSIRLAADSGFGPNRRASW